jgi:hypothetical protein
MVARSLTAINALQSTASKTAFRFGDRRAVRSRGVLGSGPPVRHWGHSYKSSKSDEFFAGGVGGGLAGLSDHFAEANAAVLIAASFC